MDDDLTFEEKMERASNEQLKLRDDDGFIYWVDNYDESGAYIHSDEGDTHRMSNEQLKSSFEFVDA